MRWHVSVFLFSLVVVVPLLGLTSSQAEEPEAHFLRLARALVRAEAVSGGEQGRVIVLWRHQYDSLTAKRRGDGRAAREAAHAYSPGRILEVRDMPADLSGPGTLLLRFVNPWRLAHPRPTLADTIVWDKHRDCAWLVSVSSTRTEARVRALAVQRGNALPAEEAPPETLAEWPATSEATHVTTIPGGASHEDWAVQEVSAVVTKKGLLVALHGWKHNPTRWVWFRPETGLWQSIDAPLPDED